ncbi:hypothetical protein L6452_38547 [Arctium lappa]|uniref:Uncharacterized protein n=1 Tax=Arctium lappa TaxID=4217 RepID=A0ACB8XQF3_ARCLA|nr:hypothetical protein L6452_38547 [Arctium lappa]
MGNWERRDRGELGEDGNRWWSEIEEEVIPVVTLLEEQPAGFTFTTVTAARVANSEELPLGRRSGSGGGGGGGGRRRKKQGESDGLVSSPIGTRTIERRQNNPIQVPPVLPSDPPTAEPQTLPSLAVAHGPSVLLKPTLVSSRYGTETWLTPLAGQN